MRIIYCAIPGCIWEPDFSKSYGDQYTDLRTHWSFIHKFRPSREAISVSALANMFVLLDNYIKTAIEWPVKETPPFDDGSWSDHEDQLAKTKASAAGRGVAECITLLLQPRFATADETIAFAVSRYKAVQAGQEPVPYNRVGDPSFVSGATEKSPETSAPVPATAPAPVAATQPPEKAPRVLTDDERQRIVAARDAEFDLTELGRIFKLTPEEIRAL